MPRRPAFDPKRPLIAAREFTFLGKDYEKGDPFGPFDDDEVSERARARQYEARAVNHSEDEAPTEAPVEAVQMTGPKGGRYTITAPWLAEPEVVRGKVNAETRLAELLGQAAGSYEGYTLTAGENGWYGITKDGVEGKDGAEAPVLNVRGEEQARQAIATLRRGEMIEGAALPAEWSPEPEGDGAPQEGIAAGEPNGPASEEPGGDPEKEATVADKQERKPEDGEKPNEPGTNQPNGAEVINDHVAAEDGNARGETEDDGDAGRPVGP